ncbi:MAG: DNA primase [Desulfobacterota bacterium]|nr:DNA primase [Thermodesulfobacteriota bacterium]MDW8001414.1 DNA primase [Deltaproteobacteria bacterium]
MKYGIAELLEKIDIVDIVSKYVKLKRSGRNFVGLCPFHKEKTPSFTVSPEKQLFYCFGCQTGGNAINFMMKVENLDFHDATEAIAREYGIPLKDWKAKTSSVYDALAELLVFYQRCLKNNETALNYLKERGIDPATQEEFKLGFSGKEIDEFLSTSNIPKDVFLSTGIFKISEKGIQDIFRGRIIIPIFDVNGKVIGFGGRSIDDRLPKYINSPESSVFSKRNVLFGLDKAKKYILEKNLAIIVEGYFDVISLFRCGLKNVVASLGTAITEEQIRRLKNYTENITLMLDPDDAGIKSALRAMDIFSSLNVNGEMVLLPEGEDPDSLVRKGDLEALQSLLDRRLPILEYYFEHLRKTRGMETTQKKLAFIRDVMPYIEQMKDNLQKRLYVRRVSELTGLDENIFWDELRQKMKKDETETNESKGLVPVNKTIIGIILNDPDLAYSSGLKEVVERIPDVGVKALIERFFEIGIRSSNFHINRYLSEIGDEDLRISIISGVFETQKLESDAKRKLIEDYVKYIKQKSAKEKLRSLTEELKLAEKEKDEKRIFEILAEKKKVLTTFK